MNKGSAGDVNGADQYQSVHLQSLDRAFRFLSRRTISKEYMKKKLIRLRGWTD